MNLNEAQIERYSRQIILSEVGGNGQERLLNGKVLIIGVGGLGSPALLYLAAAGIGLIGLIDADLVDLSNLQRQIAHTTSDLKKPKVASAAEKIKAINPEVRVKIFHERFTHLNALEILSQFDFVIDGTDNFDSKFLIADSCHFAGKPYSHGGILRFNGQTLTVKPNETACYRCVFQAPPPEGSVPSCSSAGVLGVLAGTIGTIQATEAMKYLLGQGDLLANRLLTYDALKMKFREIQVKKQDNCSLCGTNPSVIKIEGKDFQPTCKI